MTNDADNASGRHGLKDGLEGRATTIARLAIGLLQGLALWWLVKASGEGGHAKFWPATQPTAFGPLFFVAAYLPVALLAGVGRLRLKTLLVWPVIAAAVLAFLAWHDIVRRSSSETEPFVSIPLMAFGAAALFIAHHLIAPADAERRRIASYPAYFDTAWKAGVQLALSVGFTGAFWLLLWLGAGLFRVIGIRLLTDLLGEAWFSIPILCLAFSLAVHLTDVRDGLIRGVRTVALMLLSWLLLVLTVLVAGFLLALPFTGLEGLWRTGSATVLVLSAAGTIIVLINAAYQDGRPDNLPPVVLRAAVRVASILLTPLILIAGWGLSLRIGQHGLTPDRVIACACAVVGTVYAVGYGLGALVPFARKGSAWMRALEPTNITAAALSVLIILTLFSPIVDPARISVSDQITRLQDGRVAADRFDYAFLKEGGGKVGETALDALTQSSNPEIARRAREAKAADRHDLNRPGTSRPVVETVPGDPPLPPAFLSDVKADDPRSTCTASGGCLASQRDLNGDGEPEILLAQFQTIVLFARDGSNGGYSPVGTWFSAGCNRADVDAVTALRQGRIKPVKPWDWPDLEIGGGGPSRLTPAAEKCDDVEVGPVTPSPSATPR